MAEDLTGVSIFHGIPLDGLTRLTERGQRRLFPAGSQIMRQGEPGESLYVIMGGVVRVEREHPAITQSLVLAELGAGEVVGEMALLDGDPRSATVTALENTETLEISAADLAETILRYPEVSTALLRLLSRRLRNTNELAEKIMQQRRDEGSV